MKLNQAKKFYKSQKWWAWKYKSTWDLLKINYELVRALQVVSEKIEKRNWWGQTKNFTKVLTIIYTLQTNLDFEKELKLSTDLFKFYEFCRKKLIEGITSLKSKEIFKSAVNLDKMFDFKYFQVDEEINAVW